MDTVQRVRKRIEQIEHAINAIQSAQGGFVTLYLIDYSADTLESKPREIDIRTNRDALIQTLWQRALAFEHALRYFNAVNIRLNGEFTYERILQFVKYYLSNTDFQSMVLIYTDEKDVIDTFIRYINEIEQGATQESKVTTNFRY